MSITTSYGVGEITAGENHTLIRPRLGGVGKRAVIYSHGANRPALDGVSPGYADIPRYIGEFYPTIYPDMGGLYNWGNDTAISRLSAVRTFMGNKGYAIDKVVLTAGSMGAAAVCNWARQNLSLVACLALFVPSVDIEDIRANNRSGTQAGIEAAYINNAGWQTARPTHNPVEYAAQLASIPTRIWYSTDDPIVMPSTVAAFAAAHGNATVTSLGAIGHDVSSLNYADMMTWLRKYA